MKTKNLYLTLICACASYAHRHLDRSSNGIGIWFRFCGRPAHNLRPFIQPAPWLFSTQRFMMR